jgi:ubiquinone/menaquinone biosynthesis C-methylase UbiE
MNRSDWLRKMRRAAEDIYDLDAPEYGEKCDTYSNASHRAFIQKLLSLLAPRSTVLDAACGAGR